MKGRCRRAVAARFALQLLAGGGLSAAAAAASWAAGAAGDPTPRGVATPHTVVRALGGGLTFARAQVDLPWPPERVFDLVSDFDHLGDFVSAIDSSHVVRRDSTGTIVRQVGTTTLLVSKTVRMTLRFHPRRPAELRFEIVDGDFRVYYGAWKFGTAGIGTHLTYDVTFAAAAELPGVLVRHVVQRDLQRMLTELAAEIVRRDSQGLPGPGPAPGAP